MNSAVILYAAATIITLWGVAHIVPTKPVVAGFEPLSTDNRRILTMEWVAEGLTLCFIGILTFLVTVTAGPAGAARVVYWASAGMLLVLALWTSVTGGRTSTVQFRICPLVKTVVAGLLITGSVI
jgi:hypothetical protein